MQISEHFGMKIVVGSTQRANGWSRRRWNAKTWKRFLHWATTTKSGQAYSRFMVEHAIERDRMAKGEITILSGDIK